MKAPDSDRKGIVLARFVLCDHHFPGEEFCFLMYVSGLIGHDITLKF